MQICYDDSDYLLREYHDEPDLVKRGDIVLRLLCIEFQDRLLDTTFGADIGTCLEIYRDALQELFSEIHVTCQLTTPTSLQVRFQVGPSTNVIETTYNLHDKESKTVVKSSFDECHYKSTSFDWNDCHDIGYHWTTSCDQVVYNLWKSREQETAEPIRKKQRVERMESRSFGGDQDLPGCEGCFDSQPNQLAHMYPGGCLYYPS